MKYQIAPSLLSADLTCLAEQVHACEQGGADLLHLDIMDGHFVPNISFGPLLVKAVRGITDLPLDVHLMISSPESYLEQFATAGADFITLHAESTHHLHRGLQQIKALGCKPGVAFNPASGLEQLPQIIKDIDLLLIMSVNPGFGGQSFIESTLEKISRSRALLSNQNPDCLLEVDGGINRDTIARVAAAGADTFVAGAAVLGTDDIQGAIKELRSLL
jgi:ribulose-phosphate 3-epimerase